MLGPEDDYAKGEAVVRAMFAPVMSVYLVTVKQMAILEPALSKTVVLTCMVIITEAIGDYICFSICSGMQEPCNNMR
jgi:hypothetical protein